MLASLVLSLLVMAPPKGSVEVDGPRWQELRAGAPQEVTLPGPWAARRDVTIEREGDGLVVRGRWTIRTARPGWFMDDLLGASAEIRSATWNGEPAAIDSDDGMIFVAGFVAEDSATLEVEAFIPGEPATAPLTLQLMPAVAGRVTLPPAAEEQVFLVERPDQPERPLPRRGDVVLSGAAKMTIRQAPRQEADASALVTATSGIGLTVGDAELRGRASITWTVLRGSVERVSLNTRGLGEDLEITGAGIREWRRVGERIELDLQATTRDRVAIELRWSQALAKSTESSLSLPKLAPADVFRTNHSVQVARDSEIEVIPSMPEWTAVASSDLPSWGSGLVEGTPTAAYTANDDRDGSLALLRFVPVESPPVVVDVAGITIATSREGRLLMRAHYEVRNERAAHLRVTPPPGMRILGAQVAGETALPAQDEDGAWLIPLRRSIETVKGALSFPVEVTLLGESESWSRREKRSLPLPKVSAPVAVTRLTVHLPPGYTSRIKPGKGDVVDDFTRGEGINYGMGIGEVGVAEADARFQSAVSGWMNNDFESAQKDLDALRDLGASNENIDRLQANLNVIKGSTTAGGSGGDAAIERRIKEQAKARAGDDIQLQAETKKKAEEYKRSGDYERAEAEYAQAIEIGEKLALLEQEESVEQSSTNAEIQRSYASVQKTKDRREQRFSKRADRKQAKNAPWRQTSSASTGSAKFKADPSPDSAAFAGDAQGVTVYDFDDDEIDGDLLRPEGAALSTTGAPEPSVAVDESVRNISSSSRMDVVALGGVVEAPADPEHAEGRDFTQVVDLSPTASSESAGIRLSGTSGAESKYVVDGANVSSPAFGTVGASLSPIVLAEDMDSSNGPPGSLFDTPRKSISVNSGYARGRRGRGRRRSLKKRKSDQSAPPTQATTTASAPPPSPPPPSDTRPMDVEDEDFMDEDGFPDPMPDEDSPDSPDSSGDSGSSDGRGGLGRLAAPEVEASAMSVVIPSAGEAVRYQRLLLSQDAIYTVEISAREPLLPRKRRTKGNRR